LLTTGILFIIFGVIDMIFGTLLGIGVRFPEYANGEYALYVEEFGAKLSIMVVFAIIGGFWHIIIGIIGIASRNSIKMAGTLIALGIIDIVLDVISIILYLVLLVDVAMAIFAIVGIVLPFCYIIGAYKNKTHN